MRTLRCKCGKKTMWTSMGSQDCQGCKECNTTMAGHPDHHQELQPHTFREKFNQNTGKPYKLCTKCHYTDKESYKKSKVKYL